MSLGEALARATDKPIADISQDIHDGQGILAEKLSMKQATAMVQVLRDLGHQAAWKPMDSMREPGEAIEMVSAEFSDFGWKPVARPAQDFKEFTWAEIVAVCCGEIRARVVEQQDDQAGLLTKILKVRAYGLGQIAIGAPEEQTPRKREKIEVDLIIDLLTLDHRFRIRADGFNYRCLGDRVQPTTYANFEALVDFLAERAPDALSNLLEPDPQELIPRRWERFRSLEEFDARGRWLLQCVETET